MRRAPEPIVDVRQGEARPAVLAFFLLALLIGGHTMLETARDALFLGKLPASRLSLVYAMIAVLALVVTAPNARFVRRFGESRALVMTLLFAAYGTTLLYLQRPTPAVVFAIYVWSAFLGTVIVVQFWMFLAWVFTPSQGKRLFGPIAAGGVTGAIAGAGGAAAALTVLPVRSLLMGSAVAFLLAALLSTAIDPRGELPSAAGDDPRSRRGAGEPEPSNTADHEIGKVDSEPAGGLALGRGIALIRSHPYLGWIAALTAASTAAVLGVDYLFKSDVAQHVAADDLGKYFARSYAVFNAAALVVQVVVAGPLVQRVGVTRALVVMPLLLLGGVSTALITGSHAAVMITKGVDGALRHSLHRLTLELLGLPVPARMRAHVKPVIEGALPRAVQAAMAGVLLALAAAGHASTRAVDALVLGLVIAWIAAALAIRRPHLDMFRHTLSKGSLDAWRPLHLDARLVWAVVQELSSREPARVIAAIDVLVDDGQAAAVPAAVLAHPSEEVQIRALELMAAARRADWTSRAESLLEHRPPERVRVAAVRALAAVHARDAVRGCLSDESPAVRAHAAVALSAVEHDSDPTTAPLIMEILAASGERGRSGRLALFDAIRDTEHRGFAGVLLAMAEASAGDDELMDHAMLAMESVPDPRFIPILLSRVHVRSGREAVRRALVKLGEPAQEAVERAMRSHETPPAARLHLPRTLCRFHNQRAADFLTEQLAVERSGLIRYKALRGLGQLVAQSDVRVDRAAILERTRENLIEHLQILAQWSLLDRSPDTRGAPGGRLVLGLLSDKLAQSLDRAFRLLQIAYRRDDIRQAYVALTSADPRGRSNALEFLDALTADARGQRARETRDLLKLVVDDLPAREKVERATLHVPDLPGDLGTALRALVHDDDASLSALAAFHADELGLTDLVEEAAVTSQRRPAVARVRSALFGGPARTEDRT
jgi:ATP:ADP antiporter, AAA family